MSEHQQMIPSEESDPRAASTYLVGAVGIVLLVLVIVLLEVLYYRTTAAEHQRKVVEQQAEELRMLQAEQQEQLGSYRWVSRDQGRVAIPIERAMELVATEANRTREAP